MKSRELKAFLSGKGVRVDDCYDTESLLERAAESQDQWAEGRAKPIAENQPDTAPKAAAAPSPDRPARARGGPNPTPSPSPREQPQEPGAPDAAQVEAAWRRLSDAWPGAEPKEFGPANVDKSVILLHGFGDAGADYLAETLSVLAQVDDIRLLLPQAPVEQLQGKSLQTWFEPTNGQWIVDDNIAAPVAAYVHAMIRREIARGVPAHRIVVGGFAQGASVAVRAALSFPDAPLGGALALSSFFGANSATVAPANKGLKVFVCHGKKDDVVPFSEGQRFASVLQGLLGPSGSATFNEYEWGHGLATDEVADVLEFLNARMKEEPETPMEFDPVGVSDVPKVPSWTDASTIEAPPEGVPTLEPEIAVKILDDDELQEAFKDPEAMAVMQDVMMNPDNLDRHMGNPRVAKIIEKLRKYLGRAPAAMAD